MPAGNPDGGQWTNADGSQDVGEGAPYGTTPDGTPVDPAAGGDYSVHLPSQDVELGGHTIRDHVGKSDEQLIGAAKSSGKE